MDAYIWSCYFASVTAMSLHPGNRAAGCDLKECAEIADDMLRLYKERFPCPGLSADR